MDGGLHTLPSHDQRARFRCEQKSCGLRGTEGGLGASRSGELISIFWWMPVGCATTILVAYVNHIVRGPGSTPPGEP